MGRAWRSGASRRLGAGRGPRVIGWAALAAGVAIGLSALPGCKGGTRRPVKAAAPATYDGPPISVESSGAHHVVVLTAPSAGWAFTMDRSEPALRSTEVFLTATRPNPAFMHAQQVVPLRAGTGVDAAKPVDVYVRFLDFGASPSGSAGAYRLVTRARR